MMAHMKDVWVEQSRGRLILAEIIEDQHNLGSTLTGDSAEQQQSAITVCEPNGGS